jgi:hypothetical protein
MSNKWAQRMMASLVSAGVFLIVGCGSSSTGTTETVSARVSIDVSSVANALAEGGVGNVVKKSSEGTKGTVIVFEEFHTSRIGQLEIATMLVRLHDKYGMKKIGLEGKVQTSPVLNPAWYRNAGGDAAQADRQDLAVRMVAEGEISSAELMAMQYPDVEVDGTEDADLYDQKLDVKGNPEVDYLIAIAEKSLGQDAIRKINGLITAKKSDAAFKLMMESDPWVKERYVALEKGDITSAEQFVANLRVLQTKADAVSATVSPESRQGLDRMISFYETASKRSDAMVRKTKELAASSGGAPVAMIIGAAHSDKVSELLAQQGLSYALIQPADLNPKNGSLTMAQYERKSKGLWARDAKGTLGHVLNTQRKPPPVLERTTAQSYASMNLAGMLIAQAARGGGPFPDGVLPQISNLPGLRVDKDSITRDGYDVLYRAWLKQDNGQEKEVWARVGTIAHPAGPAPTTLEGRLLAATNDLKKKPRSGGGGRNGGRDGRGSAADGSDGNEPPDDLSPGARPAENEGPRDVRKGDLVISRTGRETLAVYASKREDVQKAGRISI